MLEDKKPDLLPWALGAAGCLFYLSFHSAFYNFDGVACAIAVELGDFPHLAHGNHLAYGLAGWAFDRFWRFIGYAGPALLPLQVLDSLLGGAGIGVFGSWLLRLKVPRGLAVLAAAGLAVSQAWWLWSLEAQVYMLGAFFVLLAARESCADEPRPAVLAAFHALAVLGHVGHAMFFPVALRLLWKSPRSRKALLVYTLTLGGCLFAAYLGAAVFLVRPRSLDEYRVWLLGSAALNVDKSFVWFGGYSWRHLWEWAAMTLRIFADFVPLAGTLRACAVGLGAAAVAGAAAGALSVRERERGWLAAAALLWIASYAVLFASWQPYTPVYRISDLAPLWLLIALGLEKAPVRLRAPLLGAWVLAAGLFNAGTNILPAAEPMNNAEYQEALWTGSVTPPEAWIAVSARGQVYIPYFAHRRPLNMRYYEGRTEALHRRLDALAAAGELAFVSSATLEGKPWASAFTDYGLTAAARKEGLILYRISGSRKGKPSGSR